MMLQDIGMLVVSSNRTKIYIQQMVRHNLKPRIVLYMEDPEIQTPEDQAKDRLKHVRDRCGEKNDNFRLDITVPELLKTHGIPYQRLASLNPNSDRVVKAVDECRASILIYSGPGGALLGRRILDTGKKFLHVHPGVVPYYRGSTPFYYSLLKEGRCGATAFFLDAEIDTGPLIKRRYFPAPADRTTIDLYYDPLIRSQLLVDVLKDYAECGTFPLKPQDKEQGETYFIIHPVLKHIAILAGV